VVTPVDLPAELERFARDCVAEGRYSDVSDVVRDALCLLRAREQQRREFTATLRAAEDEADRNGVQDLASVVAAANTVIDAAKR
jgi:antitoxin ParD1/3/4